MLKRLFAECFGTFWLVLSGCGSAIFASAFGGEGSSLGIGLLGVSLAFGLSVLTAAHAVGHISGGHFNPAVSVGLWIAGRLAGRDLLPYIGSQVLGAVVAGGALMAIATGAAGFVMDPQAPGTFSTNGFDAMSPGGYGLRAAFLTEVLLSGCFVAIILGATRPRANTELSPVAIGLALTLIHLISIPITNTSVNPARSTGVALFAGSKAMSQLWLFWVAPLLGAAIAGGISRLMRSRARSALWLRS